MKNRKGLEFSFAWLFAILAGSVILFLAIFAVTRLVGTEQKALQAEVGKELGLVLSPVETSIETGFVDKITFQEETRFYNGCESTGNFGSQKISTSVRSGIGKEWGRPGVPSTFFNKYIFSSKIVEGKSYLVFSKPLEMPFKISNIIYLWSGNDKFCFVNPSSEVKNELEDFKESNSDFNSTVFIANSLKECPRESSKICFGIASGCDIDVSFSPGNPEIGTIKKKNQSLMYYDDYSLMYGAIFSDSSVYECQVKRIMKRASELSLLYISKSETLSTRNCVSGLEGDLLNYANSALSVNSSRQLFDINQQAKNLRRANDALECQLF